MDDRDLARLDPPVVAVHRLVRRRFHVGEIPLLLLGDERLDVVVQRALVAFQRQHVVGSLPHDLRGDHPLATHRVDGDDRTLHVDHVQQRRNGDDLIRLLVDLDLAQHQTLARRERRDDVRGLAALLPCAARRLAVEADRLDRRADQRRGEGGEATLERLRIDRGQDVAEGVVRRRSV